MNKFPYVALVALMSVSLASCGSEETTTFPQEGSGVSEEAHVELQCGPDSPLVSAEYQKFKYSGEVLLTLDARDLGDKDFEVHFSNTQENRPVLFAHFNGEGKLTKSEIVHNQVVLPITTLPNPGERQGEEVRVSIPGEYEYLFDESNGMKVSLNHPGGAEFARCVKENKYGVPGL